MWVGEKCNMKKKASTPLFIPLITIFAIGALIFFFIHFSSNKKLIDDNPIGTYQSAVLQANSQAQKALLYQDEAAKIALDKSIIKTGKEQASECGTYIYTLWNMKDKQCFPEYQNDLTANFNQELKLLLSAYPSTSFPVEYTYIFSSKDGKTSIKGRSQDELSFPITVEGQEIVPQQKETCAIVLKKIPSDITCTAADCEIGEDAYTNLMATIQSLQTKGYTLQINSAYRSMASQQAIWDANNCDAQDCSGEIAKPSCTSPHTTGKSIDIILLKDGKPLDTGGIGPAYAYDGTEKFTSEQINNHKLIEQLMCQNGWVRFGYADDAKRNTKGEWWHFEFQTERAKVAQKQTLCAIV
jgi:D-alanyl-D-alanine dipeptidase